MSLKIISGGQSGVDIAGLDAAFDLGISTGGWLPKGCKTLDGPKREYLNKFGMKEHSGGYRERTWQNIHDSDATIRIAENWKSAGEKCTLNGIYNYGKPSLDIDVKEIADPANIEVPLGMFTEWFRQHNIKILNIAGNAEQTAPGIYSLAYLFLRQAFREIK